jgi:hypothetical protein
MLKATDISCAFMMMMVRAFGLLYWRILTVHSISYDLYCMEPGRRPAGANTNRDVRCLRRGLAEPCLAFTHPTTTAHCSGCYWYGRNICTIMMFIYLLSCRASRLTVSLPSLSPKSPKQCRFCTPLSPSRKLFIPPVPSLASHISHLFRPNNPSATPCAPLLKIVAAFVLLIPGAQLESNRARHRSMGL